MPNRPPRLCSCGAIVRGQCPRCAPATRQRIDRRRGSSASRGYDHRWREHVRKPFLRDNSLCCLCGALANVPDHYPETRRSLVARGVKDPDAFHRLRPLCDVCHNRHGARDD